MTQRPTQDSVADCPPDQLRYQNSYLLGELKASTASLDKARDELAQARAHIEKLRMTLATARGFMVSAINANVHVSGFDAATHVNIIPVDAALRDTAPEVGT